MVAQVQLSFDCEGCWGIADRKSQRLESIKEVELLSVYKKILALLDGHNIKGTFGFVSALAMEKDELVYWVEMSKGKLIHNGCDWNDAVYKDIKSNNFKGWAEPGLFELLRNSEAHYICSHGGCHIPYDENCTEQAAIVEDIKLIDYLRRKAVKKIDKIIYPRNIVGYQHKLSESGFVAYRGVDICEQIPGVKGKGVRLVNEFLSFDRKLGSGKIQEKELKQASDAKFLNARIGIRGLIPAIITKKRIKSLMDSAVANDKTLHFYTHPHNFISDKGMFEKLAFICELVKSYESKGLVRVITMEDECHAI